MKRNNVLTVAANTVVALALVMLLSSADKQKWNVPDAAAKVKNPVAASKDNLEAGKALFLKHCKSCHGVKGKGDGPKAANLEVECGDFTSDSFQKETDGAVFYKTTEGRDPMPTFKNKLSDTDRWTIINYIRTFASSK